MKKTVSFVLAVLIVFTAVIPLVSCEKEHTHTFSKWTDHGSYQSRECSECGYTEKEFYSQSADSDKSSTIYAENTSGVVTEVADDSGLKIPEELKFYKKTADYLFELINYDSTDKTIDWNKKISEFDQLWENYRNSAEYNNGENNDNNSFWESVYKFMIELVSEYYVEYTPLTQIPEYKENEIYCNSFLLLCQTFYVDYIYEGNSELGELSRMGSSIMLGLLDLLDFDNCYFPFGYEINSDADLALLLYEYKQKTSNISSLTENNDFYKKMNSLIISTLDCSFISFEEVESYFNEYVVTEVTYDWIAVSDHYVDKYIYDKTGDLDKTVSTYTNYAGVSKTVKYPQSGWGFQETTTDKYDIVKTTTENGMKAEYRKEKGSSEIWKVLYNSLGQAVSESYVSGASGLGMSVDSYKYEYDSNGNMVKETCCNNNGSKVHSKYTFKYEKRYNLVIAARNETN